MKKRNITLITAIAAAAAFASTAQAAIVSLDGTASTAGQTDAWPAANVTEPLDSGDVNSGNQLTGEGASGVWGPHTFFGGWYSAVPTWFRVDLGATVAVGEMYVWNGQPALPTRGVETGNIYYSTDENAVGGDWGNWGWTQIGTTETFTQQAFVDNSSFPGYGTTDVFDLDVTARVIGIDAFGTAGVGLAALQFFTAGSTPPAADPEITSITSLGSGNFELTLKGEPSTSYEFYSSATLDFTSGGTLVPLTGGGTDVTTDGSGDATVQMSLAGSANFVRAQ